MKLMQGKLEDESNGVTYATYCHVSGQPLSSKCLDYKIFVSVLKT